MASIKLQTFDGEILEVDLEVARCLLTIRNILNKRSDEDKGKPVKLETVNSKILAKVIEWATRHKDDTPGAINVHSSTWDTQFLSENPGEIFEILLAAEYLGIESLLDATCGKVTSMFKEKTLEEIRKSYGIKNDFTPAEELEIQKENESYKQQ